MSTPFPPDTLQILDAHIKMAGDIWFPAGFGFSPFIAAEVFDAITNTDDLQLRLNKVKGRGILYGIRHVLLRRTLANALSPDVRTNIWLKKLAHAGILHRLNADYNIQTMHISDIGMGHSVLHAHPPDSPHSGLVIKQEEWPHHQLFCALLHTLGWSDVTALHLQINGLGWQITPYINGDPLNNQTIISEDTVVALAKFAALGDLLGREDRHNENYIQTKTGVIHAIDTAGLYCNQNEYWTEKYIAGGLYEISLISKILWQNIPLGSLLLNRFWKCYVQTHTYLTQVDLADLLHYHSNTDRLAFIHSRQSPKYVQKQLRRYCCGLATMLKRLPYRYLLDHIWQNSPETLEAYPILKMYALAHENRDATFFLGEERAWIFDMLTYLAHTNGLAETLNTDKSHADICAAIVHNTFPTNI